MPGALGPLGRETPGSDRCEMCLMVVMVATTTAAKTTPASAEKIKRVSIAAHPDRRPDALLPGMKVRRAKLRIDGGF